jgi:hypothetical protein
MRFVVVLLVVTAALGGVGYSNLSHRLEAVEAENAKLRAEVNALLSQAANASKVDAFFADHQGQINTVRNEVVRINGDYAVAKKVDAIIIELRERVAALQKDLAEARKSAPPPSHTLDLGFSREGETELVLCYAGGSFADGLTKRTTFKPGRALAAAVKPSGTDPRAGTVAINHAVLRSPESTRTVTLKDAPALAVARSGPDATDWDLTPDARAEVKRLLGLGN